MFVLFVALVSFILFYFFRLGIVLFIKVFGKIFKMSVGDNFEFALSVMIFLVYLETLWGVMLGVVNDVSINLEWYLIYTFMGISAILWCYFSWELKWRAKPKFAEDEKRIAIKKIVVFLFVMLFSLYQGYSQLNKQLNGKEIDLLVTLTNLTIIPGIIALDRVLNQIKILKDKRKK